jgi:hypothetical protein
LALALAGFVRWLAPQIDTLTGPKPSGDGGTKPLSRPAGIVEDIPHAALGETLPE